MSVSLEVDYQEDNLCTVGEKTLHRQPKVLKIGGFFCITFLIRESEKLPNYIFLTLNYLQA
jgi:hypothetical protein